MSGSKAGSEPRRDGAAARDLLRKPRRDHGRHAGFFLLSSFPPWWDCHYSDTLLVDELKLGLHHDRPQQIGKTICRRASGTRRILECALRELALARGRRTSERVPEYAID